MNDLKELAIMNSFGIESGRILAEKELPRFIKVGNLIVAESGKEIAGLLYFERKFFDTTDSNNWFLTQVTVGDSFRRKGIGEKLWVYFLQFAKQNSVKRVFADIRESNTASFNLAKKLGGIDSGYLDFGDGDKRHFYRFDL